MIPITYNPDNLQVGSAHRQPNSEFRFRFEANGIPMSGSVIDTLKGNHPNNPSNNPLNNFLNNLDSHDMYVHL